MERKLRPLFSKAAQNSWVLTLILSACVPGAAVDSFTGNAETTPDPFGQNGNSAVVSDPALLDFGVTRVNVSAAFKPLTLTNVAQASIFVQSVGAPLSDGFAIDTGSCAGELKPQTSCTFSVSFTPKTTGNIAWSLPVAFGKSATSAEFTAYVPIKGLGATSVTFPGLKTIDTIRARSVQLHWDDVAGENGFAIFRIDGSGNLIYLSSVAQAATTATVPDLTPLTAYTFRVKAIDFFGNFDSNSKDVSATTLALPVLTNPGDYTYKGANGAAVVGQTYSFDFNNTVTSSDTNMSYSCAYASPPDDLVQPGTACSSLAGLTLNGSFASNGQFTFTPPTELHNRTYQFKISGNDGSTTVQRLFKMSVRAPYERSHILIDLHAPFADGTVPGKNSPFTSTWTNLLPTGSARDAQLSGSFATGWTGNGVFGVSPYALQFAGTNGASADRFALGSSLSALTQFGFTAWIKAANTGLGRDAHILGEGGESGAPGWSVVQTSAGDVEFRAGSAQPYRDVVQSQGPVASYRLEESTTSSGTAADSSGNGHNGTYQNPTQIAPAQTGVIASSFKFTSNGYLSLSPTIPLNGQTGTGYTLSIWVKTPLPNNNTWKTAFRGSGSDHEIIFKDSSNEFGQYLGSQGGFYGSGVIANTLTDGWHLFTIVGSGGVSKYYIDGAYIRQTTGASNDSIYAIGNYQGGNQPIYDMDEVAIWQRPLSDSEIADQYSLSCKVTIPQGRWFQLSGFFDGSRTSLFVNKTQKCLSSSLTFDPATTDAFTVGALADGTAAWPGSMGNLRVYSTSTSAPASTNFMAEFKEYMKDPSAIIGLTQWADGADPNANGIAPANGTVINTWKDRSGNGNDLTLGSGAPAYNATGFGGYPSIYYNGTSSHFSDIALNNTTWTMVYVSALEGSQNARVIGDHTGQNLLLGYWNSRQEALYFNGAPAENLFGTLSPTAPSATTNRHLYTFTRDGSGNIRFYTGRNLFTASTGSSTASIKLQLGCGSGTAGECSKVYIGSYLLFDHVLSADEFDLVQTYYETNWGF